MSAPRTVRSLLSMLVAGALLVAWPAAQGTAAQTDPKKQAAAEKKALEQKKKEEEQRKKDEEKKQKDEESTADKELQQKACPAVDVKFDAKTDKKQHPVPVPPAGKAMLFVVRPTMMGNKIQSKLAVDGQWVGGNRGDNYFFVELAPGEHYFCSQAENKSVLKTTVEAGKTYYFQQKISMGFMKARNTLVQIDEAEGQKGLDKAHLSIFEAKK